jgi:hypothetical protein
MDVSQFHHRVLEELSKLPFVERFDFQTEVFILKGKVFLNLKHFLQIYFNSHTGTIAFSLIEKKKRIWGIDFDYLRGWHLHPEKNPEDHIIIEQKSIKEIIEAFADVWQSCNDSKEEKNGN